MESLFNRFIIRMTKAEAESCSHSGECIEDVRALLKKPYIIRQLDRIAPEDIAAELKETGGWEAEELTDSEKNRERILWIAACNISEEIKGK